MKTAVLTILALILLGAAGFGAATFGFVQVPGISPIDFGKPVLASNDERRGWIDNLSAPLQALTRQAAVLANTPKKAAAPPPPVSKVDPNLGDEKIATIWDGLEADKLANITAKWPEKNLAKILLKMDPDLVTEYLGTIPADRAVKISQAIQQLGSLKPTPDQPG